MFIQDKSSSLLKFASGGVCFPGSCLAQDRGKLEAQIESLCKENESLRKTNEQDSDTLRIKCKIIEDQTETIGKLKAVSLAFYFGKTACGRFENLWTRVECPIHVLSVWVPTVVEFKTGYHVFPFALFPPLLLKVICGIRVLTWNYIYFKVLWRMFLLPFEITRNSVDEGLGTTRKWTFYMFKISFQALLNISQYCSHFSNLWHTCSPTGKGIWLDCRMHACPKAAVCPWYPPPSSLGPPERSFNMWTFSREIFWRLSWALKQT